MLPEELLNCLHQKNNNELIFKLVAQQVKKDWERSGLWDLEINQLNSPNDFILFLQENLSVLVMKTPEKLKNLLYIMDLNELSMYNLGASDIVEKLTKEILKREYLKVKLRLEIG